MADLGRNDPCHCGSGRKYKKCCLPKDDDEARKAHVVAEAERQKAEAEKEADGEDGGEEKTIPSKDRGAPFAGKGGFQEKTARAQRSGVPVAGWSRSSTGNR